MLNVLAFGFNVHHLHFTFRFKIQCSTLLSKNKKNKIYQHIYSIYMYVLQLASHKLRSTQSKA